MRQVIITKYCGPTDNKGARVRATCEAKTIYVSWDHALSSEENHIVAAMNLAKVALVWDGKFTVGSLDTGYVFVPSSNLQVG